MIFRPVDETTINRDQRDRLRILERGTPGNDRPQQEEVAIFSHAADVTVAISPPWPVRRGGQIVDVVIAVLTAGSGSSTFRVRLNGSVIGSTITLASGETEVAGYIGDFRIPKRSRLSLESVTVGTGLADLGAAITMKG